MKKTFKYMNIINEPTITLGKDGAYRLNTHIFDVQDNLTPYKVMKKFKSQDKATNFKNWLLSYDELTLLQGTTGNIWFIDEIK